MESEQAVRQAMMTEVSQGVEQYKQLVTVLPLIIQLIDDPTKRQIAQTAINTIMRPKP